MATRRIATRAWKVPPAGTRCLKAARSLLSSLRLTVAGPPLRG